MRLNKLFFIAAIALGFMACNADDQPEVPQHETDSFASITVKFPGTVGTRALPEDWNKQNTWTGRDDLKTVTVFLVNLDRATVDKTTFTEAAFNAIEDGVLQPKLAMKATAGDMIRAYVVINGEAGILDELQGTGAAGFAAKFAGVQAKIASQLASYDSTANKETIMMTNDADAYSFRVLPGISELDAKTGTTNNVQVKVERVVSRAFMTVTPEATAGAGWPVNAIIVGNEAVQIAKVTKVEYAVGQSNTNFYLMKKSTYEVPNPVYEFNPATLAEWKTGNTDFDYTGLKSFSSVTPWAYDPVAVSTPLTAETTSKFVLPVNHRVDLTDPKAGRPFYKKGNTTYFEIRASFLPLEVDGDPFTGTTAPDSLFWGEVDRKFYTVRDSAEAKGQKATGFGNGIMKYVLWLNPNSLESTENPNPMVSPTVRNQVYHAHIDAFERMGLPNNPLDPNDPDNAANPDNPINVQDPLKTDFTYLSVKVQVLPWTIHTYKYSLKDPGTMY